MTYTMYIYPRLRDTSVCQFINPQDDISIEACPHESDNLNTTPHLMQRKYKITQMDFKYWS